ncbi:MAG: inositol monophosphatase family protein [Candidatus Borkfalkiaceae bacterium]|nr:inositol monophosphatase family protein [Christensenellaceae bacterium]
MNENVIRRTISLVHEAGKIAKDDSLRKEVAMKGNCDFVTAVDTGISAFLKEKLKNVVPGAAFFCEEEDGALKDPCWILDPIDGTTNLVYGYPFSSVSLAFYEKSEIVFGVVYNPFSEETFFAEKGKGATLNGERISVSERPLQQALIEFGAGSTRKKEADANFSFALELFKECVDLRRVCSSALDLCFIASGRIDGYFEKVLKPWDIAAGSLILSEAGGVITDYHGNPVRFEGPTSVVAGNVPVHGAILGKIGGHIHET